MYKLINGKLQMTVYSKEDKDLYTNSGWKLIEENRVKKKKVSEDSNENLSEQAEFTEGI